MSEDSKFHSEYLKKNISVFCMDDANVDKARRLHTHDGRLRNNVVAHCAPASEGSQGSSPLSGAAPAHATAALTHS